MSLARSGDEVEDAPEVELALGVAGVVAGADCCLGATGADFLAATGVADARPAPRAIAPTVPTMAVPAVSTVTRARSASRCSGFQRWACMSSPDCRRGTGEACNKRLTAPCVGAVW